MADEVAWLMRTDTKRSWLESDEKSCERAFTWGIHEDTVTQLHGIEQRIRSMGYTPLIGLEMETTVREIPKDPAKSERIRSLLIKKANEHGAQRDKNADEINFLRTATAGELVFYQIYTSELRQYLMPDFNANFDRSLLHDQTGTLEIRTVPLQVGDITRVRESISNKIKEFSNAMGLEDKTGLAPMYHINLSFNNSLGNVFSPDHPEYMTAGKVIMEGMTYSLSRASMFLYSPTDFTDPLSNPSTLGPSRQSGLRIADGRIEIKFGTEDGRNEDIELVTLLAFTGVLEGMISNGENPDIVRAETVLCPAVRRTSDAVWAFHQILNDSYFGTDGNLIVNRNNLALRLADVLYELQLREVPPSHTTMSHLSAALMTPRELGILQSFLGRIRVAHEDGNPVLVYPEDEPGIFYFDLPAIGLDKVPDDIRKRLEQGEEMTFEECDEYLLPGEAIPHAEKRKPIDIERLKKYLTVDRIIPKFHIVDPAGKNEVPKTDFDALTQRTALFLSNRSLRYLDIEYAKKLMTATLGYSDELHKKITNIQSRQFKNNS